MANRPIYLDFAAATPMEEKVFQAMRPYFSELYFNPSAPYQLARNVRTDIEDARRRVAQIIGGRSSEIIFTAGATESINLAFTINGHVVTTAVEHTAVLEVAKKHAAGATIVGVDKNGRVSVETIAQTVQPNTSLISVGIINNETGTVQDIKAIAHFVKKEREKRKKEHNQTPLYLHVDASQAAGIIDLHVARLGVDMMTLNGGKMYGPKQVGALYVHGAVKLSSIINGGGQERGLRSGTENVPGIIGFATALELAEQKRKQESKRLTTLKQKTVNMLLEALPEIEIISPKHSAPHILSIAWPGIDAERIVFALEAHNVFVATGSACAANKDTRSHVLQAMGLSNETIDGSLRLSFGRQTTLEEVTEAVKIIVMVFSQEFQRVNKQS